MTIFEDTAQEAALITGETPGAQRDAILARFQARELKYMVNVAVLTTRTESR